MHEIKEFILVAFQRLAFTQSLMLRERGKGSPARAFEENR
jgi:hypothetical protein